MSSHLTLRPVEAGDHAFLLALVDSTRGDLAVLDHSVKAMLVRLQYEAQLTDYRRRFPYMEESVVLADGVAAGRLYVACSHDEIRLVDISLLPGFRGQGIGYRLLARLQDRSQRAGLPLHLHVLQDNPAGALYRRLGFQPGETDGLYIAMEWHPILLKE
ncbi:Acetyltransferase (GNAT) family protein [Duganella sp. CF458]|uniref:GNAT family N-acetyltransferase n=1 Tax=Duganella sp. CF458 TaxID=1884368 RepID=UPI0008E90B12|nr:GNAT family N-acetyltransferase [Duganella sp. CF458]SFG80712.1 Acetyltransferase (GNAT) family protein [Duganella sp. CF458]